MLRGITTFVCDNCGHRFKGMDIEWNATAFSQPLKCPKCGSMNTHPIGGSLLEPLKFFYRLWKASKKK